MSGDPRFHRLRQEWTVRYSDLIQRYGGDEHTIAEWDELYDEAHAGYWRALERELGRPLTEQERELEHKAWLGEQFPVDPEDRHLMGEA